jgi:hypothetical protein
MDSLKLFPIFENKFVYLSDIYRVIIPSIIVPVFVPILFVVVFDQFVKFMKNIFVTPHIVFLILVGSATIIYGFPKLPHHTKSRNFDSKKTNKIATRFSQRLRQKTGIL